MKSFIYVTERQGDDVIPSIIRVDDIRRICVDMNCEDTGDHGCVIEFNDYGAGYVYKIHVVENIDEIGEMIGATC